MSNARRPIAAGLILFLTHAAPRAVAQEPVPISIPVPPPTSTAVVAPSRVGSALTPPPIDPIAVARKAPHHIERKVNSPHWRRLQGRLLGYPEEFPPRPLGSALYDHGRAMVANGEIARMILFQYDFVDGSDASGLRGREGLRSLLVQLERSPYPLLIEPTPDEPGLAEARRLAVLAELAAGPVAVAPERVVIGYPRPRGLSGIDAQILDANAMDWTREYGPPIPINRNGVNSPSGVTGR